MRPGFSVAAAREFLSAHVAEATTDVERLPEGLESDAFRFDVAGDRFVLRIASSSRGFEKDRWAQTAVGSQVPVPAVLDIGAYDDAHAYCVSLWLPGASLEDLPPDEAGRVVGEVQAVWEAIAACDVTSVGGFGDFDASGSAPARRWRDVLRATLEAESPTDDPVVLEAYARLVDDCPEERGLVHGDFGANNVLVLDGAVSGVLDWEEALVGDPLYDVANVHFWATYLPCMDVQAAHFDRTLSGIPGYRDRVLCYALRIGIEEAREDPSLAAWATARCRQLIAAYAAA